MAFPRKINQLCTPAAFYFVISMISFVFMVIQNLGNEKTFTMGLFSCRVANTLLVLAFNLIYILFWTWILHLICKDGYTNISWFLVLLPFVFLFVLLGAMMISRK
jgi:hypothetical protein